MNRMRECMKRVAGLFHKERRDAELEEELAAHLEMLVEQNVERGMTPEEARRAARIALGGVEQIKEAVREQRGLPSLESFIADVRFGLRMLRKSPGFAAIAIVSLALGIGANTATFTLAKAVLFDAISVSHPDELRLLTWRQDSRSAVRGTWGDFYSDGKGGNLTASFSYPVYEQLRQNHALGDLIAFNAEGGGFDRITATIDGHAEIVVPELVSGNYFQQLGVGAQLGRPIEPRDDVTPGSGAVAVISDAFWARRFGRSPSVIGKTIDLNLIPMTIVGVAQAGFGGASHAQISSDVYFPLSMQPVIFPRGERSKAYNPTGDVSLLDNPLRWWVQIMGRVQPGIPEKSAQASLTVATDQAVRATMTVPPDRTAPVLTLLPGRRGGLNYVAKDLIRPISLLLTLAGLVLMLACTNIANLLLVRGSARQRELSMRLALGAGRSRLMRQALTESLMLSSFGGAAGLGLAYLARDLMAKFLTTTWGRPEYGSRFDWRVVVFTLAISSLTGVIFGLGPAWQATRTNVNDALKEGGASVAYGGGFAGRALVVVQVSLCVLLLVGAGLFARTLVNLRSVDVGFRPKGLLLFAISPPKQRYPAPRDIDVLHTLEQRIAGLPGFEEVTLSGQALLAGSTAGGGFFPDGERDRGAQAQQASWNMVGQSFFATMGIPLLAGRGFDATDTATSPKVAIVNEALAQKFFPGMNPVGKTFRRGENDTDRYQIIGVSADAKYASLREATRPTFYTLYLQEHTAFDGMTFEVRTRGNPLSSVATVRSAVQSVDKDLPLIDVRTQTEQIDAAVATERIFAAVTSGFGVLALVLAVIGVYGVISYTVVRRTNEIGIRMAVGAHPTHILKMVLRQGIVIVGIGVVIGIVLAGVLSRLVSNLLFGVTGFDLPTYAIASVILAVAALFACCVPARRAMRVDPMVALRHE